MSMARFVVGDELGNIKLLKYNPQLSETNHTGLNLVYPAQKYDGPPRSVQQIAVKHSGQHDMITAAFSDGNCCLSQLTENDSLTVLTTWKENHIKGSKFIGIANRDSTTFTCTSGGILQKTSLISSEGDNSKSFQIEQSHLDLPSRLYDWRLSEDGLNFAYGGDEVEVSLWNTDRAFQTSNSADQSVSQSNLKRRKKNHDLYPGEIWRARNLPNDHLGLRHPVRITTLAFLQSSLAGCHLITGTQFGDLRRYDTRAGRRPICNWTGFGNVGGVKALEKGFTEHQLFMSDGGSNLCSIDLRTGTTLHRYRGISGAVTSIAPSPTVMLSVSLDRFARVCSILPPPQKVGENQERKPEVLGKCYLGGTPTVVVWDQNIIEDGPKNNEDDEIWDKLENIS